MALLLNLCSGRVAECNCVVDPDLPEGSTVRDAIDVIDVLLSNPERTFKDCVLAQSIADALNNGLSLVDCDAEVASPEPFRHFRKHPSAGRFPRFPRRAHPGSAAH